MNKIIIVFLVLLFVSAGVWLVITTGTFSTRTVTTDPQIERIKKNGVLKVGLEATFLPMEYLNEKGEVVGFGADLAKEIAKGFGVPVRLINVAWDNIFNELNKGSIDMIISSVTITSERSKTMSFSKPYFNAGQVIVVLASNSSIKGLTDLKDKKIGVQSGTTSEIEAVKLTDKKNVYGFKDYDIATKNLLAGNIDAMIMDYPPAVAKTKTNHKLKLVGGPFTQEFYGVVVAKGNESLLLPINKVIENLIRSGEMKGMENRWLK